MNSIMTRRSMRKYLDKPVESEKTERILRAAMQAPTGHNAQDFEFIVVTDGEMRFRLSRLGPYSHFAEKAPLHIVVCENTGRMWEGSNWQGNLGAVCQNILLQVEEEGLGACWIGVWPYPERMAHVKEAMEIPDSVIPYALISIGYKEYQKRFDDRFDTAKIHYGKY